MKGLVECEGKSEAVLSRRRKKAVVVAASAQRTIPLGRSLVQTDRSQEPKRMSSRGTRHAKDDKKQRAK